MGGTSAVGAEGLDVRLRLAVGGCNATELPQSMLSLVVSWGCWRRLCVTAVDSGRSWPSGVDAADSSGREPKGGSLGRGRMRRWGMPISWIVQWFSRFVRQFLSSIT